jgi:hypothetical protein
MTPGTAPELPATGNGSSRLAYENGPTVIYENTEEVAEAKPGLKAVETNAQAWGSLVNTTNYTTSSSAAPGESVRLVYDDGALKVYENERTAPTVSGSKIDIDSQAWGKITWTGSYDTATSGDRSNQVWSNGVTQVYLNETARIAISGTSKEVDFQQWGKLTWDGEYSSTSSGDRSRQVYSGPGGPVFLNEDASVSVSGSSKDVEPREWGSVTWNGNYATASGEVRSRQIWSKGDQSVFLNETPVIDVLPDEFVSAREENTLLIETQKTTYGLAPNTGVDTRSRSAYRLNGQTVFENLVIERSAKSKRTYAGLVNVNIPAVILSLDKITIEKRDGTVITRWEPQIEAGYSGRRGGGVLGERDHHYARAADVSTQTHLIPNPFRRNLGGGHTSCCCVPIHHHWHERSRIHVPNMVDQHCRDQSTITRRTALSCRCGHPALPRRLCNP